MAPSTLPGMHAMRFREHSMCSYRSAHCPDCMQEVGHSGTFPPSACNAARPLSGVGHTGLGQAHAVAGVAAQALSGRLVMKHAQCSTLSVPEQGVPEAESVALRKRFMVRADALFPVGRRRRRSSASGSGVQRASC